MGCYDYIEYKCPNCGKKTSTQTKVLGDSALELLKKGSVVNAPDCLLLMKDACEHCRRRVCVEILGGKIHSFRIGLKATHEELPFGKIVEWR